MKTNGPKMLEILTLSKLIRAKINYDDFKKYIYICNKFLHNQNLTTLSLEITKNVFLAMPNVIVKSFLM